jgi:hypothetical protein
MYTTRHDIESGRFLGVTRTADGAQIPADPRNGDYAAFLAWNAQQSPPLDTSDRDPPTDAERVQRLASAAVMDTLARAATDPFAAAVVALFDVAFTMLNDERVSRSLPRLTPAEIFPAAIQALIDRQSAPP